MQVQVAVGRPKPVPSSNRGVRAPWGLWALGGGRKAVGGGRRGGTDDAIPLDVLNLFISPLDAPDGSLATETHFRGKLTHEY